MLNGSTTSVPPCVRTRCAVSASDSTRRTGTARAVPSRDGKRGVDPGAVPTGGDQVVGGGERLELPAEGRGEEDAGPLEIGAVDLHERDGPGHRHSLVG